MCISHRSMMSVSVPFWGFILDRKFGGQIKYPGPCSVVNDEMEILGTRTTVILRLLIWDR